MKRTINLLAVVLAVALVMIAVPTAQADIEITYSINGGATVHCFAAGLGGSVVCGNVAGPPLLINTLSATSNSPGTSSLSKELGSVLEFTNNSASTDHLTVDISSNGFTMPVTPPNIVVDSHVGGTVAVGAAANLLSFQSCIDGTNSLITTPTTACPAGTIPTSVGTPSIKAAAAFSNDQVGSIASLAAPYSIQEVLTLTLGAGADMNLTTSTTLTPAVPEPASIFLLGGAVLLACGPFGRWRRNKSS